MGLDYKNMLKITTQRIRVGCFCEPLSAKDVLLNFFCKKIQTGSIIVDVSMTWMSFFLAQNRSKLGSPSSETTYFQSQFRSKIFGFENIFQNSWSQINLQQKLLQHQWPLVDDIHCRRPLLRGNASHDKDLLVNVDKNRACEYMGQSRISMRQSTGGNHASRHRGIDVDSWRRMTGYLWTSRNKNLILAKKLADVFRRWRMLSTLAKIIVALVLRTLSRLFNFFFVDNTHDSQDISLIKLQISSNA